MERLEAFLRFLTASKTEIRYSATPVAALARKYGEDLPFLKRCAEKCEAGENWDEAWKSAVMESAERDGFPRDDEDLFLNFGAGFGTSDTEGQISHFSLYLELGKAELESAKEERGRKSKLYRMLGVSGGVAAAILLC